MNYFKKIYSCFFLLHVCIASAQQIKGVVKNTKGEALLGATIVVEQTQKATTTNIDGEFSIKAQKGQILKVSYVGFKEKRQEILSDELIIILQDDVLELNAVVVTGYQQIKSRVFTGASASVKIDEIKIDALPDVSRMLQGRVAGLNIQEVSGAFGSAPRINIRGGASIIGNVQPLWVIDGVMLEDLVTLGADELVSGDPATLISSAIAGLNTADIESIQVLKDASATSVYGARALNGVIIVTTKNPQKNTPNNISYIYEQSFRKIPSYAEYDLLNSQQTLSIYQELENKGYFTLSDMLYGRRGGIYHQLYKKQSTINPQTGYYYLPNTPQARLNFFKTREYANTNWFKHLFTLNPIQSHTISFSGGGKQLATYASVGFYHDAGWSIADKVSRITSHLKNTFYLGEKFKTTFSLQGNMREQQAPGTFQQRKNVSLGTFERDFDINPFSYALSTSRTLRLLDEQGELEYYRNNWADFNIVNEYRNNYLKINLLDFKIHTQASYKISKSLELNGLISIRRAQTSSEHFIKENSNVIGAFRANENPIVAQDNIYLFKDKDNPHFYPKVGLTHGGIFNKTQTNLNSYQLRFATDFNKKINYHNVKVFAFTELRSAERSVNPFEGYGIQYDKGNQVFTNPLILQKLINQGNNYFSLSEKNDRGVTFSLNGTYDYKGKYIFNTILNYEGSNAAGANSTTAWLPTWNIGGKWNIDHEQFIGERFPFLSFALRTSYGLTAKMNDKAISSNAVFSNFVVNRYHFQDRENALAILYLENQDLTWEKMHEFNFGLDVVFKNNRISANLDFYKRNSFDLIDLIRTSGVGGQYYKYANFGDMQTIGMELALQTKNILTDTFKWNTNFTMGYMKQQITRFINTPNAFDMVSGTGRGNIVGFPKGALFSFNYQGVNSLGLPTFDFGLYPLNGRANADVVGADFADTQYVKSYLIYHGPTEPKFNAGITNSFHYKNWEFSFFVTAQAGNKIRLNPSFDPSFADLNVFSEEYYNRWIFPTDELLTQVPSLPSKKIIALLGQQNIERAYNTYNYSQNRVADGSFVRLKNISLGYNFSKNMSKKMGFKTMVLRTQITNPFLIYADSKLNGQDPEYYRSGGVSLPTPKQYTLSVQLGL